MDASGDTALVEKLYEFGQRITESGEKKNDSDYLGIISAAKGSVKCKQLAAQLIPRFFKHFPNLSTEAIHAQMDLCEEEELGIRVQGIRGLPLLCKDKPENVPKMANVLGQLLGTEESLEKDAVQKALISLLRQDVKSSLTALFELTESSEHEQLRDVILLFLKDKVFPLKGELLKPQEEMERHITDLIKKSLIDVTGAEFKMFTDFLQSLSIFGEKAPPERIQELLEIIEAQADLNAQFQVSDTDHVDRILSCFHLALPVYQRGASNSRFLIYINKNLLPVFEKFPEDKKLELLKDISESSPYTTAPDARQLLPFILTLLKTYMPLKKSTEEFNYSSVECLLFTFHQLASKTPNTTNSLCGYKIVTGQPSDRLGEDFSELFKDFTERLKVAEELTKAIEKKLTEEIGSLGKAMSAAKDEATKTDLRVKQATTLSGKRSCSNILTLTKPLHQKSPTFIGGTKINLSWKDTPRASVGSPINGSTKRPANSENGKGNTGTKKGRIENGAAGFVRRGGPRRGRGSFRGSRPGRGRGGSGRL